MYQSELSFNAQC